MFDFMMPEERVFRVHVAAGPFQSGVALGRWRLVSIKWPCVIIAVAAAPRQGAPEEYHFRFECSNYPQAAPNAQPWDTDNNAPSAAAKWPGGGPRITAAFNPGWQGGQAIYLPCDRVSMQGHNDWRTQHPHLVWTSTSDITLYLEALHDLLSSSAYTGPRGA